DWSSDVCSSDLRPGPCRRSARSGPRPIRRECAAAAARERRASPETGLRKRGQARAETSGGRAPRKLTEPVRGTTKAGPTLRRNRLPSSLDAHHLTQGGHLLDQVGLGRDDRDDVLVGHRRFVDHLGVLAAFDSLGGADVVLNREAPLGLGPGGHGSSRFREGADIRTERRSQPLTTPVNSIFFELWKPPSRLRASPPSPRTAVWRSSACSSGPVGKASPPA